MTWAWLTLTSGVLNALWSSQIKSRVQKEGALTFTVSMRWGVALALLPFALYAFKPLSLRWWTYSTLSGTLECASLWAVTRGARRDFYSTYALSNIAPLFSALWWGLLAAVIGSLSGLFSKLALPESGYLLHSCFAFMIGAILLTVGGLHQKITSVDSISRNVWSNRGLILFSTVSTVVFYSALQMAPLSRVSPLVRVNLVVGFLLSYFHLGEKGGWKSRGFGAILLLAGLVLVLWKF